MSDVFKNLRPLHVVVLDRRVLILAHEALEERNGDKTTIEGLRLVLRSGQLVDTKDAQATALNAPRWAVLNVNPDPVMSHPRLERSGFPQEIANLVLIRKNSKSTAQRLRKKLLSKIRDRKSSHSIDPDKMTQQLKKSALTIRSSRGVQERSLLKRMFRTEQSSNNLPEQLFNLGIIVRKLPDPLINAPPVIHYRTCSGTFTEGDGGLRREDYLGREWAQLLSA